MQPWFPFYWADYSGKTMHLSMGQHGAYTLLLRYVYTTGKGVPDKQRYSIAKASLEPEKQDVDAVLEEFWKRKGDLWVNDKALEVIDEAKRRHQAYVDAGKKGGKQRYGKATSDATAGLKPGRTNYKYKEKEKSAERFSAVETPEASAPKEVDPSWNGCRSMVSRIVGEENFLAYLADAKFIPGPPAQIEVSSEARASLIRQRCGTKLRGTFPVEITVTKEI